MDFSLKKFNSKLEVKNTTSVVAAIKIFSKAGSYFIFGALDHPAIMKQSRFLFDKSSKKTQCYS